MFNSNGVIRIEMNMTCKKSVKSWAEVFSASELN
jgi:hypothetical protein